MGLGRDLRLARRLPLRTLLDLAIATAELAFARARLAVQGADKLVRPPPPARSRRGKDGMIDRVAFAIPRMGARVPWRSSCLVQALAAQRWLARNGIATDLVLGARKSAGGDMEAHAWLKAGKRTVVGGEPGAYQEFRPARRP